MTDKVQLIKQEIERIEQILDDFNKTHNNTIDNGIVSAKKNICKQIKSFIDALPEEPKKQPKFKVGDKIKFKVATVENIVRVITDIKETGDGGYMYYFPDGYIHSVSDEEIELVKESINTDLEEEHNEDLEKEIENYINRNFSEGCDGGMLSDSEPNLGGVTYCDLAKLARHFAEWKDEQVNNLKDEIQNNLCASSGFNDEYSHGYQDCGMKVMEMIDKILNK